MQALTDMNAVGVIADIEGLALTPEDIDFIQQPELSGLILFTRNYQSPQQLNELTQSILQQRSDFLICVDHEGGRVQRFREGFTRLPAMLELAKLHQQDSAQALELATDLGWLMAAEVRAYNVHLSFAPVLDIEHGLSAIIGDRAFGYNAKQVVELAGAFIEGMQQAGMVAVGKHFPGHGGVVADSHLALPVDERSWAELEQDIQPFAELVQQQKLAGIMPAHVLYQASEDNKAAGFSEFWLQQILRQKLGFNGVIFSDDLTMEGAAHLGGYAQRTKATMAAGANAILVCNNRQAAQEVVAAVREQNPPHLSLQSWQGATPEVNKLRLVQTQLKLQQL